MGFLGVRFFGQNYLPCLKLVRIMLATSNLARKYKQICSFIKYTVNRLCVRNLVSRMLGMCYKSEWWQYSHNFLTWRHHQNFLTLFCFSYQFYLLVHVSSQYHYWFWITDNFLLWGIDWKSRSRKYSQYWVLPNIWGLQQVRDTICSKNVSNKTIKRKPSSERRGR